MKLRKPEATSSDETATLPVLNIMFLLIPTLLLAMEVASLAGIVVSPPRFCGGCTSENPTDKPDPRPRTLKVMIRSDGFLVEVDGTRQGEQLEGDKRSSTIPLARSTGPDAERWDYPALAKLAAELRPTLAEGALLELSAEADIEMQVLVSTIEAAQDPDDPLTLVVSSSG